MNKGQLFAAIGDLDEGLLEETAAAMAQSPARPVRPKRHVLWIAAALLTLLLAACGWIAYRIQLKEPNEKSVYQVNAVDWTSGAEQRAEISFQRAAMILHCDTGKGNELHGFRPKLDVTNKRVGVMTFYAAIQPPPALKPGTFLVRYLDVGMSGEEALATARLSVEQAASYYTKYWIAEEGETTPLLMMELLDAPMLYQDDLILGEFGGEAEIVSHWMEDEYECLAIRFTGEMTSIHLFLFHPEEQYLLHLSADAARYDVSDLQTIADETEIIRSKLYVEYKENGTDFYILSDPEEWLHTEKR